MSKAASKARNCLSVISGVFPSTISYRSVSASAAGLIRQMCRSTRRRKYLLKRQEQPSSSRPRLRTAGGSGRHPRHDAVKLQTLSPAPEKKVSDGSAIRSPRVLVSHATVKEIGPGLLAAVPDRTTREGNASPLPTGGPLGSMMRSSVLGFVLSIRNLREPCQLPA